MISNEQFDKIKDLKWYPWVGENYFKIPKEHRIFILGESSRFNNLVGNTKEKYDKSTYSHEHIKEAVDFENQKSNFLRSIQKTFHADDFTKRQVFWNKLAFTNFIQQPMDYSIGETPSIEHNKIAWRVLFDLLPVLKPAYCIFFGNSAEKYLWRNTKNHSVTYNGKLRNATKVNGAWPHIANLTSIDGTKTIIILIKHPAAKNGTFDAELWYNYLKEQIPFIDAVVNE